MYPDFLVVSENALQSVRESFVEEIPRTPLFRAAHMFRHFSSDRHFFARTHRLHPAFKYVPDTRFFT